MSNGSEIARLVLRGVVGSTMIAHGVRHGRTLEGTAGWFKRIGFREPGTAGEIEFGPRSWVRAARSSRASARRVPALP